MGLEDMEKSLALRRQRLEQRLADRREVLASRMAARSQFEGDGKVDSARDTPPPDRCDSQAMPAVVCKPVESIASVHSHGVKELRRMFCEPYVRPRRFSSTVGFVGSLLWLAGVAAICWGLREDAESRNGMTSLWDVMLCIGLCGILQSTIYFKMLADSFLTALGEMNLGTWFGFVLCVMLVLLLSAVLAPVMFVLNCSNFIRAWIGGRNGKRTAIRAICIVLVAVVTLFGTIAAVAWINDRLEAARVKHQLEAARQ